MWTIINHIHRYGDYMSVPEGLECQLAGVQQQELLHQVFPSHWVVVSHGEVPGIQWRSCLLSFARSPLADGCGRHWLLWFCFTLARHMNSIEHVYMMVLTSHTVYTWSAFQHLLPLGTCISCFRTSARGSERRESSREVRSSSWEIYITKPPPEWVGYIGGRLEKGGKGALHQGRKVKGMCEAWVIWSS